MVSFDDLPDAASNKDFGFSFDDLPDAKPTERDLIDAELDKPFTPRSGTRKGRAEARTSPDNPEMAKRGPVSVMDGVTQAETPAGVTASRAPVRPEVRAAIEARNDTRTPAGREAAARQPGWAGQISREQADRQALIDKANLPTLKKIDTRVERRQEQYVAQGLDPDAATSMANVDARIGRAPGAGITGNVEPTKFDFDTAESFRTNPALNNVLVRGLAKGGLEIAGGAAGVGEAMSDLVFGSDSSGTKASDWIRQKSEAIGENRGDFLARNLEGAISSLSSQIPSLIAGAAAGSAAVSLASMAYNSFGGEYSRGKQAGLDPSSSATRAGLFAAFEVIGESFGLGGLIKTLGNAARGIGTTDELLKFFASNLSKEVPGELLTTTGQFGVDKMRGLGLNTEAGWSDYLKQVGDTVVQTLMQGGLQAGGTTGVATAARFLSGGALGSNPDLDAIRQAADAARAQEAPGAIAGQPGVADTTQAPAAPQAPASQAAATTLPDGVVTPASTPVGSPDLDPVIQAAAVPAADTVIESGATREAGLTPLVVPGVSPTLMSKLDEAAALARGEETTLADTPGATIEGQTGVQNGITQPLATSGSAVQPATAGSTAVAEQVPGAAPDGTLGAGVRTQPLADAQQAGVQPVATSPGRLSDLDLEADRRLAVETDAELQARASKIAADNGAPPPRLIPSSQPGAQEMAQAWSDATGFSRPIMFHDPKSKVGGMFYKGRMWVNTASPTGTLYIAGHESFHEIERAAEQGDEKAAELLGAFRQAALPLISEEGRREYGLKHLFKGRVEAAVQKAKAEGRDPLAARVEAEKAAMESAELPSELSADAIAQVIAREPKKFFESLQKQAPEQFGPIVTKLLDVVRKFKSALAKRMNLGAKDVLRHIKDLDRFESEVKKLLIEWKRSRGEQVGGDAATADTTAAAQTGAEKADTEMSDAEKRAAQQELDDEMSPQGPAAEEDPDADPEYNDEPKPKYSQDAEPKEDPLAKIDPNPTRIKMSKQARELSNLSMLYGEGRKKGAKRSVTAVAVELHERARGLLEKFGIPAGDLTDKRMVELASDVIAGEIEVALRKEGNAATWYSEKLEGTMSVAALIHPELESDARSRVAFLLALAITSQNMAVPDNLNHAEDMYASWKSTGKFSESMGWGTAKTAMKKNFARANAVMNEYSPERLEKFLNTQFTVGELDKLGWSVSGENMDTVVYGSAIFGPKIGNGFFQNISGNFDPLTMDMWFMRGMGRIVGDLIDGDPALFEAQRTRLLDALDNPDYDWSGIEPSSDFAEESGVTKFTPEVLRENEDALVDFAKRIGSSFDKVYKANSVAFQSGERVKPELVLAASVVANAGGTKDAPASGTHRNNLRAIFSLALEKLKKVGIELTNADGQAIWWFPEKDLYATMGAGNKKSAPTDYQSEIIGLAKKRGVHEQDIKNAIARSRRGDAGTGPESAEGTDRPSFGRRERGEFLKQRVIGAYRAGSWAFGKRSGDSKGLRVSVGSTKWNATSAWELDKPKKNRLKAVGISAPTFFEIDSPVAFSAAITAAKQASPFGAAVYVYPEEEYAEMRLFVADGGKTGFALKGDDIVSVFNSDPDAKGAANAALLLAVQLGGRRLDAFDTALPHIYGLNGFQAVARLSWDDSQAPEGWDKAAYGEFGNGEPDVVFMAYNPQSFRLYQPGDGTRYDTYEDAVAAQQAAVQSPAVPSAGPRFSIDAGPSEPTGRPRDGGTEGAGRGVSAERGWSKRAARPGSVTVDAWHYGKERVPVLSGSRYGDGIRGKERGRIDRASDPRIKRRIYFYIPKGDGTLPNKEGGLGPYRYDVRLGNLYDPAKLDPRVTRTSAGEDSFESSVLDAGYDGYLAKDFGMAVVLDADVPVGQPTTRKESADRAPAAAVPSRIRKSLLSREIGPAEQVASQIPSARLSNGSLEIDASDRDAANRAMEAAGLDIRFSLDDAEPQRAVTLTAAFKRWFAGSAVVDENGEPLVVYHGTGADISTFSDQEEGNFRGMNVPQDGIWFASDPARSEWYANTAARRRSGAANILPVYLSIKNPYIYTAEEFANEGISSMPDLYTIQRMGHDGVIVERGEYGDGDKWNELKPNFSRDYVVFSPAQIKSATGNSGAFNPRNPDIRYSADPDQTPVRRRSIGLFEVDSDNLESAENPAYRMSRSVGIWTAYAPGTEGGDERTFQSENKLAARKWLTQVFVDDQSRGDDLLDTHGKEAAMRAVEGFKRIAKMPGATRRPTSTETDIRDIFAEVSDLYSGFIGVEISRDDPPEYTIRYEKDGKRYFANLFPKRSLDDEVIPGEYYAETSNLKESGLGADLYQAAFTWAAANQIKLRPDYSLTPINTFRRTEQMISAALRVGTTKWMTPHPDQRITGWNDNPKNQQEDDENLGRMLVASARNLSENVPEVNGWVYNALHNAFESEDGRRVDGTEEVEVIGSGNARTAGIGRASLARGLLARSLLAGETRPGELGQRVHPDLLEGPADPGPGDDGAVEIRDPAGVDREGADLVWPSDPILYSVDPDYEPKKTVKAYKLFATKPSQPGKLFPLFIGATKPTPVGQWIEAENLPTKGFAPRPGWHSGQIPMAAHLRSTKTGRIQPNRVWAEIEVPADVDWQAEADRSKTKDIKDRTPEGGFYKFSIKKRKADGNLDPIFTWMISGAIKINRLLEPSEVASILRENGVSEQEIDRETSPAGGSPSYSLDWDDLNPLSRDAINRIQFRPGAAAYRVGADIVNKALDVVRMKPMSQELSRRYRKMKLEVQKAQDIAIGVAEEMFAMNEADRELVSDIIEGEVAVGVVPTQALVDLAAKLSKALTAQSDELVRLGMISQDAADRWRDRYLPRFYEPKLRASTDPWTKAVSGLISKPSSLLGIKGQSFRGRGVWETIPVSDLKMWVGNGWEIRDPDYDPKTSTEVVVWADYTREERERMGEIRDAAFRFVMGYTAAQKDIALGRLYAGLAASDSASKTPKDKTWVKVPTTQIEDTRVNRYGNLAGLYVSREVFDHISKHDDYGTLQGVMDIYKQALSMWKEGKALALDTPIPTPAGWTTMGEIREGDTIFDERGAQCKVTFATPVQLDRECFEVEFSDGEKIVADGEHLWFTVMRGQPGVRKTVDILATLREPTRGDANHSVPVAGELQIAEADLPVPPYALGVWLGDGHGSRAEITSCERDHPAMVEALTAAGMVAMAPKPDKRSTAINFTLGFDMTGRARKDGLQPTLRAMGLLGNKHIPATYLRASRAQRRALLQGLMDTDGSITERGQCEFYTTLPELNDGVLELLRSLGYKPTSAEFTTAAGTKAWRLKFHAYADEPVFLLPRKASRLKHRPDTKQRSGSRQIVAIKPVASVPVRCIQVSSESRLYLAGKGMVPTHNTVLNPVSHANNIMSNVTMAHFAGVSYWDAHKYVGAVSDLMTGDPMVKEARDAGLFLGTMSQEELTAAMPDQLKILARRVDNKVKVGADAVFNALSFWLRKPMGKAYEAEDLFFRYLIYREARSRGLEADDAVDYAQRYIFTYDDLPKGARILRDMAIPFISYTYKAVPVLAYTAMAHPERFAAPAAILAAVNAAMYAIAYGDEDDDWAEKIKQYVTDPEHRAKVKASEKMERDNLAPWMKGHGALLTPKAIRLGQDSVTNLPLFMDVSRIFPGGDLLDANSNAGGVPFLQPLTPSNPLLSTFASMVANTDVWFGKNVVDKDDTTGEAVEKRGMWLWKQFAPAIAINNYHWDRAGNVIANVTGKDIPWFPNDYTGTGRDGLPVQPGLAAAQTFGLKIRPYDLERNRQIEANQRKALIRDLQSEVRQINRLESIGAKSERQAENERTRAREKIDRLRQGLTVDGDDPNE